MNAHQRRVLRRIRKRQWEAVLSEIDIALTNVHIPHDTGTRPEQRLLATQTYLRDIDRQLRRLGAKS